MENKFTSNYLNKILVDHFFNSPEYYSMTEKEKLELLRKIESGETKKVPSKKWLITNKTSFLSKDLETGKLFFSLPAGQISEVNQFGDFIIFGFSGNTCKTNDAIRGDENYNLPAHVQIALQYHMMSKDFMNICNNASGENKSKVKTRFKLIKGIFEDTAKLLSDSSTVLYLGYNECAKSTVADAIKRTKHNKKLALNFTGYDDGDKFNLDKNDENDLIELFTKNTGLDVILGKNTTGRKAWISRDNNNLELNSFFLGMSKIYRDNGLVFKYAELNSAEAYKPIYIAQSVMNVLAIYFLNASLSERKSMISMFNELKNQIMSCTLNFKPDISQNSSIENFNQLLIKYMIKKIIGDEKFNELKLITGKNTKYPESTEIDNIIRKINDTVCILENAVHANQILVSAIDSREIAIGDGFRDLSGYLRLPEDLVLNHIVDGSSEYVSTEEERKKRKEETKDLIKRIKEFDEGFWDIEDKRIDRQESEIITNITESEYGMPKIGSLKSGITGYRKSNFFSNSITGNDIIGNMERIETAQKLFENHKNNIESITDDQIIDYLSKGFNVPPELVDQLGIDKLKTIKTKNSKMYERLYNGDYLNYLLDVKYKGKSNISEEEAEIFNIAPSSSFGFRKPSELHNIVSDTNWNNIFISGRETDFIAKYFEDIYSGLLKSYDPASAIQVIQLSMTTHENNRFSDLVNSCISIFPDNCLNGIDLYDLTDEALEAFLLHCFSNNRINFIDSGKVLQNLSRIKSQDVLFKAMYILYNRAVNSTDIAKLQNAINTLKIEKLSLGMQNLIIDTFSKRYFNHQANSWQKYTGVVLNNDLLKKIDLYQFDMRDVYNPQSNVNFFCNQYLNQMSNDQRLVFNNPGNNGIYNSVDVNSKKIIEFNDACFRMFDFNFGALVLNPGSCIQVFFDKENVELFKHVFGHLTFYKPSIIIMLASLSFISSNYDNYKGFCEMLREQGFIKNMSLKQLFYCGFPLQSGVNNYNNLALNQLVKHFCDELSADQVKDIDLSKLEYENLKSILEKHYDELTSDQIANLFSSINTKDDLNSKVLLFYNFYKKLQEKYNSQREQDKSLYEQAENIENIVSDLYEMWNKLRMSRHFFAKGTTLFSSEISDPSYCEEHMNDGQSAGIILGQAFKQIYEEYKEDDAVKENLEYDASQRDLIEKLKKKVKSIREYLKEKKASIDNTVCTGEKSHECLEVEYINKFIDAKKVLDNFKTKYEELMSILNQKGLGALVGDGKTLIRDLKKCFEENIKSVKLGEKKQLYDEKFMNAIKNLRLNFLNSNSELSEELVELFNTVSAEKKLDLSQFDVLYKLKDKNKNSYDFVLNNISTILGDIDDPYQREKIVREISPILSIGKGDGLNKLIDKDDLSWIYSGSKDISEKVLGYLEFVNFDKLIKTDDSEFLKAYYEDKIDEKSGKSSKKYVNPAILSSVYLVASLRNKLSKKLEEGKLEHQNKQKESLRNLLSTKGLQPEKVNEMLEKFKNANDSKAYFCESVNIHPCEYNEAMNLCFANFFIEKQILEDNIKIFLRYHLEDDFLKKNLIPKDEYYKIIYNVDEDCLKSFFTGNGSDAKKIFDKIRVSIDKLDSNKHDDFDKDIIEFVHLSYLRNNLSSFLKYDLDTKEYFSLFFNKELDKRLDTVAQGILNKSIVDNKLEPEKIKKWFEFCLYAIRSTKETILVPLCISQKILNEILDASLCADVIFKDFDTFVYFMYSIPLEDIDQKTMQKIVSKMDSDLKIENVRRFDSKSQTWLKLNFIEKLITETKDLSCFMPLIEKLDENSVDGDLLHKFLQRLNGLDFENSINVSELQENLINFMKKMEAGNYCKENKTKIWSSLKACLCKFKGKLGALSPKLLKLVIEKTKGFGDQSFIEDIKALSDNKLDIEVLNALSDVGYFSSQNYYLFKHIDKDAFIKAANCILNKFADEDLKTIVDSSDAAKGESFSIWFESSNVSKVVFDDNDEILGSKFCHSIEDLGKKTRLDKITEDDLPDLRRFYLYFNHMIKTAKEKYNNYCESKNLAHDLLSELIKRILATKPEDRCAYDFFLKLGIFLDIAIRNEVQLPEETLKSIIEIISSVIDNVPDNERTNVHTMISSTLTKIRNLYADKNIFESNLSQSLKEQNGFEIKNNIVMVSSKANKLSMVAFDNDINKCCVEVDGNDIRIPEIAKQTLSDAEKNSILPELNEELTWSSDGVKLFKPGYAVLPIGCSLKCEVCDNGNKKIIVENCDSNAILRSVNAGKYKLKFIFDGGDIFDKFEREFDIEIKPLEIKDNKIEWPAIKGNFEYSGDEEEILSSYGNNIPNGCRLMFKIGKNEICNEAYEPFNYETGIKLRDAGDYKIFFKVQDENGNYVPVEKMFDLRIESKKLEINNYLPVIDNNIKYNGEDQQVLKSLPKLPDGCEWQFLDTDGKWKKINSPDSPTELKLKIPGDHEIKIRIVSNNKNFIDSDEGEFKVNIKAGSLCGKNIFPKPKPDILNNGSELELFDDPDPESKIPGVHIKYRIKGEGDDAWKDYSKDKLKETEIGNYEYEFKAVHEKGYYAELLSGVVTATIKSDLQEIKNADSFIPKTSCKIEKYNGEEQTLVNGPIADLNDLPEGCELMYKIKYENKTESDWKPYKENSISGKDAGVYKVWFKIDGGLKYKNVEQTEKDAIEIKIEHAKLENTVGMWPTANKIIYNGELQSLLKEPKIALPNGCRMLIGTEKSEKNIVWQEFDKNKLPCGVNAKKYRFWFKIVTDDNYEDFLEEKPIDIEIKPLELSDPDSYFPKAVSDLKYNLNGCVLFKNPEKKLPKGLCLLYRAKAKGSKEDIKENNFIPWNSDDIPKGFDSKDYAYEFKIASNGNKNYKLPDVRNITSKIEKATFDLDHLPKLLTDKLVYNGKSQSAFVEPKFKKLPEQFKLMYRNGKDLKDEKWKDYTGIDQLTVCDADDYTFEFKINGDKNHDELKKIIKFNVAKKTFSEQEINERFPVVEEQVVLDTKRKQYLFSEPKIWPDDGVQILWKDQGQDNSKYQIYDPNTVNGKSNIPELTELGTKNIIIRLDGGKNYNSFEKSCTITTLERELQTLENKDEFWPVVKKCDNNKIGYKFVVPKRDLPSGCVLQYMVINIDKQKDKKVEWKDWDEENPLVLNYQGEYQVYFRVNGGSIYKHLNYTNTEGRNYIHLDVKKKSLTDMNIILPKARQDLKFDGNDKNLFEKSNEGLDLFISELTEKGCKLKYRFDGDDNNDWKDYDIKNPPKEKEAKEYSVYFMIDGGENYEDLEILEPVKIKIESKENTKTSKLEEKDINWSEISAAKDLKADDQEHELLVQNGKYELPKGYKWKYSLDNGDWQDTIPTANKAGKYSLQVAVYNEKDKSFIQKQNLIEVNIQELKIIKKKSIDLKDVIWPKAVDNLESDDNDHELLYTSEAKLPEGCKFMYSFEPNGAWSYDIPNGKETKEYQIYCKVVGDGNDDYEPLEKSEPIKVEIKQKEDLTVENESKITSITTDKIELKDKKDSEGKHILLNIIRLNLYNKEILVDALTHAIVNSKGEPIDENGIVINSNDINENVRIFKDVYKDKLNDIKIGDSSDKKIFDDLKDDSLIDKLQNSVFEFIKSSDKENGKRIKMLEVNELEDKILTSGLNKEIIEAYINNVYKFVGKHDKKYKLKDENGNINWQKVGEAACKEFSSSLSTKVSGSVLASLGGAGIVVGGTALTAEAAFGVGIAALGTAAPYVLIASGPFALVGVGIFITSYLVRRSKRRELSEVKVGNNGTIDVFDVIKRILGPKQEKQKETAEKDNSYVKDQNQK